MSIRLNKAIRELNIGIQTAADFLMKKYGVEGADNPALKLTDEWYEGLCKEFSTDAAMRTQVDKMAQKAKEKERNEAFGAHDQTGNYREHIGFTGFSGGRDKQKMG